MCAALNCPAWRLQNSLVAPRRLGDDEYTAMVRGLVYLAGCFHPTTNEFAGSPHPKMVERQGALSRGRGEGPLMYGGLCEPVRRKSRASFRSHGSGGKKSRLGSASRRRHGGGIGAWSRDEVASEIARLGMTDAIRSQADASMAQSDAREFQCVNRKNTI
eukprot:scaffold156_cov33-Attheya_sp.AAC.2